MVFGFLFLVLVVAAGWWLYSRWSAFRDAQAERRGAEMLYVFETRNHLAASPPAAPVPPSGFYPTLPGSG